LGQKPDPPAAVCVGSDAFSGSSMSRATIILLVIVLLIVAGLVWLSRRTVSVPLHPIEQVVTLNATANAAP
jgi:hypothetical protein